MDYQLALLTLMNLTQAAMDNIRQMEKGLTPNPTIDEHIGKAYNELQQALIKLNNEVSLT